MNNLKTLGVLFVVVFGVATAFNMAGVREAYGMSPYAVDALIAACSAVLSAFILTGMRRRR